MGYTRDTIKNTGRFSGWALFFGAVLIVLAIVISAMAIFGFGLFQRGTADFRGDTDVIEQTRADGDYRIAAYEDFFDLCAGVQSDEARIAAQQQELASNPSQQRVGQINANIAAITASRAEKINQYNANAAKDYTRGQFQDSDLPYTLSVNDESTDCAA